LVAAALAEGATWEQIGEALDMPRSNAHRKHGHLARGGEV
jgi:hypothetical protein